MHRIVRSSCEGARIRFFVFVPDKLRRGLCRDLQVLEFGLVLRRKFLQRFAHWRHQSEADHESKDTVEQARDLARLKLAEVIGGEDPAEKARQSRNAMTVAEMCDWYLTEARAGNILGRKNLPIKSSSLDMDESRIRTHIVPLLGKRVVKHLKIADVEQMQTDVKNGKTAKPRTGGRGGMATGGPGVAGRRRISSAAGRRSHSLRRAFRYVFSHSAPD